MRILFLIVARGGSKSIPRKNLLKLNGISLIGYKAISAAKSQFCTRLIISTDDPEIQADARKYGVEVPFTRPAELATDEASTEDVVWHAMQYIETETDENYDALMLLEPSSPFATHDDYDRAIEIMVKKNANVVVGMREVTVNSIFQGPMDKEGRISNIIENLVDLRKLRRQDMPQEYTMNGAFYLLRWEFFKKYRQRYCDPRNTYGLVMPTVYSIEIDNPIDAAFAQFLIEHKHIDTSYWEHTTPNQVT